MKTEFEVVVPGDEAVAGALVSGERMAIDIADGLQDFGIEADLTPEELFAVGIQAFNSSLCTAVKAGIAFMAAQEALKIQESNASDSDVNKVRQSDSPTFVAWIKARNLTKQRVYEVISIAKGYLAIPAAQRKNYLALGKYKAIKLASIEPEALAELAEKNPDALDEMALMSRSDLAQRIANLSAQLEKEQLRGKRLTEANRSSRLNIQLGVRTEDVRAECMALQLGSELSLNSLRKLFDDTEIAAPEGFLQVETIWIAANAIASRALDLIQHIRDCGPESLPDRPQAKHLLGPDEAARWLRDYHLIENRFEGEKAVRESSRDAERPRSRGRPKGSANKAGEE